MTLRRGRFIILSMILFTAVFFQNCSELVLQDGVMVQQSLFETQESTDLKALPKLLNSENLRTWRKSAQNFIVNENILGNQFSIILAADSGAVGNLLTLNSGNGSEEISVQVLDRKVRLSRLNSIGTSFSEYLEAPLPTSNNKMVIAASVGAKSGEMYLLVNGIVQESEIVKSGSSFDFSYIQKFPMSNPTGGSIAEYIIFAGDLAYKEGRLTRTELNVMSRLVARNNNIPNVIFDPALLDDQGLDSKTPIVDQNNYFAAAKIILDNKCINCHRAGGTSPNLALLTENTAISSGLIIKSNPEASPLYNRLQGSAGPGTKNMPLNGSITSAEVKAIADWINNLK